MTLALRLSLAMVAVAAGTTVAILFFANQALETFIGARALRGIETHARLVASKLEDVLGDAKADVIILNSARGLDELVRARVSKKNGASDDLLVESARDRLAFFMKSQLLTKKSYSQYRIIGIHDGGREIIRVDRSGPNGAVRIVRNDELRPVGHTSYFRDTVKLAPGEIYSSPVVLRSDSRHAPLAHAPIVEIATPIFSPDRSIFGILAIDVDLTPMFESVRPLLRDGESSVDDVGTPSRSSGRRLYIVNDRGEYLIHPNSAREFTNGSNTPRRMTDDFSELSALLATKRLQSRMISDAGGARFGASFVPLRIAKDSWLAVVELVPHAEIVAPIGAVQRASLIAGIGALFCAVALAILLARSIARPVVQMMKAIQTIGPDSSLQIPEGVTRNTGEVGILAASFERMAKELNEKAIRVKREIEKRERMYVQLCDSSTQQNAIFANAVDGILTLDESGRIDTLNPAAERMFGCFSQRTVGSGIGEFISIEDQDGGMTPATMSLLITANFAASHRLVGRRRDGTTFPIEVLLAPMSVGGRKMFVIFVRDLTARKSAEERFRLAVELCPSGMVMYKADGTILLVNTETEKLFRYPRDELIGKSVDLLIPQGSRAEHARWHQAIFDSARAHSVGARGEFLGLRKDGTEFPIEIALNTIPMRDGSTVLLSSINDVSNRKRSEQAKDEFVAMVSHELRTPLTSITASLGLLVADPADSLAEPAKRLLIIAHSNSMRLVRLLNDILDIEKIESGKIEFHMRRIDVRLLVEQAIEANRGFASQFNVVVKLDPESVDAPVHVDVDRLTQVITNLLSNAAKYSPAGGEVMVTIAEIGKFVRISVRDHGPGIPEKFKSRIFERFAQAESAETREKGGTGLGLSIVKQIVNKLGGEAGFEAAPSGGSIFFVDLPRSGAEVSGDERPNDQKIKEVA
jgi:PAS domain S-box-containing protein